MTDRDLSGEIPSFERASLTSEEVRALGQEMLNAATNPALWGKSVAGEMLSVAFQLRDVATEMGSPELPDPSN